MRPDQKLDTSPSSSVFVKELPQLTLPVLRMTLLSPTTLNPPHLCLDAQAPQHNELHIAEVELASSMDHR